MFASYIMAYLLIGGCAGVLASAWQRASGSVAPALDETKDKLDELFLVMNLKNGQDEFVKVNNVEEIELYTAYHLDIPLGIKPSTVIGMEELIEAATYSGSFDTRFDQCCADMQDDYFDFDVDYDADSYFNSTYERVQLGERMWVTVSVRTYVRGLGVFKIPVTVSVTRSGLSEKYWK